MVIIQFIQICWIHICSYFLHVCGEIAVYIKCEIRQTQEFVVHHNGCVLVCQLETGSGSQVSVATLMQSLVLRFQ